MNAAMTPKRYADLCDYSQRVGNSDAAAEVSKAELAGLIARIQSAETTVARMSGRDGNPHIRDAAHYIDEASQINAWAVEERVVLAANAQAIATLAATYEQRTANLLSLAQLCASVDGPSVDISKDIYVIESRLGLNPKEGTL